MKNVRRMAAGLALGSLFALSGWAGCGGDLDPDIDDGGTNGQGGSTTQGPGGGNGNQTCPGGQICGDVCTQTAFDPSNCGACGTVCGEGEVCSQGQCAVECLGGSTQCGVLCVNTDNDPAHCGDCDAPCDAGLVCAGGSCALTCAEGGGTDCSGICVDTQADPQNCGDCGEQCDPGLVCSGGECQLACAGGTDNCGGLCVNTQNDPGFCGNCTTACESDEVCSLGVCSFECIGGTVDCNGFCVDTDVDPNHCGACGDGCGVDEVCDQGSCSSVCGGSLDKCGNVCVDTDENDDFCGDCDTQCSPTEDCVSGSCVECDSNVTDCDGDGWTVAQGDCCDKVGSCSNKPELVNPGSFDIVGNSTDDNCNGFIDLFDLTDAVSCDSSLATGSTNASDYAKAMGICRTTVENPATMQQRTWGLISAELSRADGTALATTAQIALRNGFGSTQPSTLEGQRLAVLSTGSADPAASKQTGTSHSSSVDIGTCADADCIDDWFASTSTTKGANELPVAPGCGDGTAGQPNLARDSAMLRLRLRAPTNAKAFQFNSYFLSAEYPEFVCTDFNDQLIALVSTPAGDPVPVKNPTDKNLMVYNDGVQKWPIGINIAAGTNLFSICDATDLNDASCNSGLNTLDPQSCQLGAEQLTGTGFQNNGGACTVGGGSFWLTTNGNVIPGEIVELRVVIWDVGDNSYDSLVLLDGFRWLETATQPGTGD